MYTDDERVQALGDSVTALVDGAPGSVRVERWQSDVRSSYGYEVSRGFLWLSDVGVLCLAFALARYLAPAAQRMVSPGGWLHWQSLEWLSLPAVPYGRNALADVLWIPLVMAPATLLFVHLCGGYRDLLLQRTARVIAVSLTAPVAGLAWVAMALIALKIELTSRAFLVLLVLFSAFGLLLYRAVLRRYKRKRLDDGCYARNVILIGSGRAVAWMHRHFERSVSSRFFRLRGYLRVEDADADLPAGSAGGSVGEDPPCLGAVGDLGSLLVHLPIHQAVAVPSSGGSGWLAEVIEQCEYFRIPLRVVPRELLAWQERRPTSAWQPDALHLPEIVIAAPHLTSDAIFVKRVIDVIGSTALLVLLSPLFLLVAVLIKLTTPNLPVFYPWRVVGYKGREFTGYKFTTMVADADERKAELQHMNEMTGPVFKITNDPRITPLGKWLRKYSINELPQLWSVLKGDMSLVGPRPAYPNELARYELWHKRKLCVQPGITCLWQIRGRHTVTKFDDWVRMDLEYIDNWSLWLDVVILARTVRTVIAGSGA